MLEPMTEERAYEILGVAPGTDFSTISKRFAELRKKYHPDVNPYKRKEYTEVLAAFELLSFNASGK